MDYMVFRSRRCVPRRFQKRSYIANNMQIGLNDDPMQGISKFYLGPDSKRKAFLAPD
jgi:hypothetical protein